VGAMTHLLADYGWVDSGKFPSPFASQVETHAYPLAVDLGLSVLDTDPSVSWFLGSVLHAESGTDLTTRTKLLIEIATRGCTPF
jgi:hypothetical protein